MHSKLSRAARAAALGLLATLAACAPEASEPDAAQAGQPAQTAPAASASRAEFVSTDLMAGLGLPFSEAARVGDLILLSGMIGTRPGTLELVEGGLAAEGRQTLENIEQILRSMGASKLDIVKCTVMLDDIGQWGTFNQTYVEFFGDHRPARSAFGADGLALGAAVEVECIAVAPGTAP